MCSPPFASLSYALPAWLPAQAFSPGTRVAVPLGRGLRMGIVVGQPKEPTTPVEFVLKFLLWPLAATALPEWYIELARQVAHRQNSHLGQILASLLPAGLRTTKVRLRFFGEGKPQEHTLRDLSMLTPEELTALGELWMAGQAEVCHSGHNPLDMEQCALLSDPPWPVRPVATAQMRMLEFLWEQGAVTRRKLLENFGKGAQSTLSTLAKRNLVSIRPLECALTPEEKATAALVPEALPQSFTLTPHQMQVFRPLEEALLQKKGETHLLFGITGSGKTALYLELARTALNEGKSVLLLAPEVALAFKLWNDTQQALPKAARYLFHGYQSPTVRENTFRALINNTNPIIVIGTRSALFLPLENIGLIVLDEEHDSSFKQDEGFMYQAKEIAWYRAGKENALLLLGSATPDVKTFHAAMEKHIPVHSLTQRVGHGTLPAVKLLQLPKGRISDHLLLDESREALRETVKRGEQAIILLNRRGYAPLMYCLHCNTVARCPTCDIGLAYHKGRERLLCHYCGYAIPFPSPCSQCKGMHFLPMGQGTEKLEEDLAALLPPSARVLRLDRDSTRRQGRMEEILHAFARKEAAVLVGTQMLSKGHHFPDVTLAIVADADIGLNMPDYRAAERTFQLLVQAAGRSGRGENPGSVIIQTRDMQHYCWQYVTNADYEGFFTQELALRAKRRYPPFIRLALIRISYPMDSPEGESEIAALGTDLRAKARELNITVLGPAPAPLPFLKGRRRFHCLVKAADWPSIRTLFNAALTLGGKTHLRVTLDLDPVNML